MSSTNNNRTFPFSPVYRADNERPSPASTTTSSSQSSPQFQYDAPHFLGFDLRMAGQSSTGGAAPLPSPSATGDHQQYFGALQPQTMQQHPGQQQTVSQQQQQPQPQYLGQQQQQQGQHQAHMQQQHVQQQGQSQGQHHGAQGNDNAMYLKDFSLIAEAAKRAQVAVVSRDLEDMSL